MGSSIGVLDHMFENFKSRVVDPDRVSAWEIIHLQLEWRKDLNPSAFLAIALHPPPFKMINESIAEKFTS